MGLSIALVGCGEMGSSLLKGWLTLPDSISLFDKFWVVAPHREKVEPFLKDPRVVWVSSPQELPPSPHVLVFAVKPSILKEILPLYQAFDSLIVSVAAGKSLSFYERFFSNTHPIVRVMPNLPVGIHKGAMGLFPNATCKKTHKERIKLCFSGLGFCLWVNSDEEINKITAISGSGPAYVYFMIESLAHAAKSMGFEKDMAMNLALHTFWGASSYAHDLGISPTILREHVTSPKGTTAAALNVLESGNLYTLMKETVHAAYTRAKELSK